MARCFGRRIDPHGRTGEHGLHDPRIAASNSEGRGDSEYGVSSERRGLRRQPIQRPLPRGRPRPNRSVSLPPVRAPERQPADRTASSTDHPDRHSARGSAHDLTDWLQTIADRDGEAGRAKERRRQPPDSSASRCCAESGRPPSSSRRSCSGTLSSEDDTTRRKPTLMPRSLSAALARPWDVQPVRMCDPNAVVQNAEWRPLRRVRPPVTSSAN